MFSLLELVLLIIWFWSWKIRSWIHNTEEESKSRADQDPHFPILPDSNNPQTEEPEQEVDDENQELEAAVAAWQPHFTQTLGKEKNAESKQKKQGGWELAEWLERQTVTVLMQTCNSSRFNPWGATDEAVMNKRSSSKRS